MARQVDLSPYGIEQRPYSIEEWLALERRTGERFEYHEGRLLPFEMMAGGTFAHSVISANVSGALFKRLYDQGKAAKCSVCSSDLKIRIPGTDRYLLPDGAIVCGTPVFDTVVATAVRNPVVVVEVLSKSSEGYDSGEKFEYYASLPTLRHYVLVSQEEPRVEVRSRADAGALWSFAYVSTLEGTVTLPAVGLSFDMAEVYFRVDFGEGGEGEGVSGSVGA